LVHGWVRKRLSSHASSASPEVENTEEEIFMSEGIVRVSNDGSMPVGLRRWDAFRAMVIVGHVLEQVDGKTFTGLEEFSFLCETAGCFLCIGLKSCRVLTSGNSQCIRIHEAGSSVSGGDMLFENLKGEIFFQLPEL
jgi:hypothetical protein